MLLPGSHCCLTGWFCWLVKFEPLELLVAKAAGGNFTRIMQCCVVISAAHLAAFVDGLFCFLCLLLKQFELKQNFSCLQCPIAGMGCFFGNRDNWLVYISTTLFARTLWLICVVWGRKCGALGGFTVPLLLIVVDWFRLVSCAGKPELWVPKLFVSLSPLLKFPELLELFLRRLFCWNSLRLILSYACAWMSYHFWNSTKVVGVSIDVTVYSVPLRRMLCGFFSLRFFKGVALYRSAVYSRYLKTCT